MVSLAIQAFYFSGIWSPSCILGYRLGQFLFLGQIETVSFLRQYQPISFHEQLMAGLFISGKFDPI